MIWIFTLPLSLLVITLLVMALVRFFFTNEWDRFSAWTLDGLIQRRHQNVEINEKKTKFFASMEEIIDRIGGPVLEIGCGTGQNLPFFPKNTRLMTCDLNDYFKPFLMKNSEKHSIKLEKYMIGNAEDMSSIVPDNSCSCVVSSFLLCCVDQEKVLREIMRVLKPGGRFYFIEHVIEPPGSWVRYIQIIMTPIWRHFKFNCHLDRDTTVIEKFGFENLHTEIWYRPIEFYYFFSKRGFIGYGDKTL